MESRSSQQRNRFPATQVGTFRRRYKIFINYRRDDSLPTAGRIHDKLVREFGKKNIFMDVDHIPAGVDFVKHLREQVGNCDVLLALIGPGWLDAKSDSGERRIDDPNDFVALEIAAALGRDIRLIPVLLDGTKMPRVDALPEKLRALIHRNAVELRNSQFGRDSDTLVSKIREGFSGSKSGSKSRLVIGAAAAATLAAAVGWGAFQSPDLRALFTSREKNNSTLPPAASGDGGAMPSVPAVGQQGAGRPLSAAAAPARFAIKESTQVFVITPYDRSLDGREACQARCAKDVKYKAFEVSGQCRLFDQMPTSFSITPINGWTVGIRE